MRRIFRHLLSLVSKRMKIEPWFIISTVKVIVAYYVYFYLPKFPGFKGKNCEGMAGLTFATLQLPAGYFAAELAHVFAAGFLIVASMDHMLGDLGKAQFFAVLIGSGVIAACVVTGVLLLFAIVIQERFIEDGVTFDKGYALILPTVVFVAIQYIMSPILERF